MRLLVSTARPAAGRRGPPGLRPERRRWRPGAACLSARRVDVAPPRLDLAIDSTASFAATVTASCASEPVSAAKVTFLSRDDGVATVASTSDLTAEVTGVAEGVTYVVASCALADCTANDSVRIQVASCAGTTVLPGANLQALVNAVRRRHDLLSPGRHLSPAADQPQASDELHRRSLPGGRARRGLGGVRAARVRDLRVPDRRRHTRRQRHHQVPHDPALSAGAADGRDQGGGHTLARGRARLDRGQQRSPQQRQSRHPGGQPVAGAGQLHSPQRHARRRRRHRHHRDSWERDRLQQRREYGHAGLRGGRDQVRAVARAPPGRRTSSTTTSGPVSGSTSTTTRR